MSEPTIIAEWQKNSRESVRVTLGEYAGKPNCDVRIWYEAKDGSLKPSPKGVTVSLEQLPQLAEALVKAQLTAGRG